MVSTAHGITHDSGRVFGVEKDLSGLVSELGICILAAVSNADNARNARMFTTSYLFFIGGKTDPVSTGVLESKIARKSAAPAETLQRWERRKSG